MLKHLSEVGECTHLDFDLENPKYWLGRLTKGTDRIVRVLEATGKLPCIAIVDCINPSEVEFVEFPDNQEDLVSFVRELVKTITAKNHSMQDANGLLEELQDLHFELESCEEQKKSLIEAKCYLNKISGNPVEKLAKLLGVYRKEVAKVLTPEKIRILRKFKNSNYSENDELFPEMIIEAIVPGRDEKLERRSSNITNRINEIQEIFSEANFPSLLDAARKVARNRNMTSVTHQVINKAGTIAGEMAKPSLWLSILKLFI